MVYGELMTTGRTNWDLYVGGKRSKKEADDSYKPNRRNIPGLKMSLPSFLIERGYMDFIKRMHAEACAVDSRIEGEYQNRCRVWIQ